MKKVLIVHPDDPTTRFLNRIKNSLIAEHSSLIHHFNIKPNDLSHLNSLNRMERHQGGDFIIFLGHGRSDGLCGSKGVWHDFLSNESLVHEYPEKYYYKEKFIDENNSHVFRNKNIFCLSCRSNEKIADVIFSSGANSFIGFGNIPTSREEFEEVGYSNVSANLVRGMKTELNYILKRSLGIALSKNFTVAVLVNYIEFLCSQRISYVLSDISNRDRFMLADNIFNFKSGIRVLGNDKSKLYT